jgi:hypothetical protein
VRLGIDRVARGQKGEILVRGYYRGRGEIGPFFLGRIYDEESGEPIRFERITGRDLLQKATQLSRDPKEYEAWPKLASLCGREFTNKEAKHALGVAEATLAKYLAAYVAAALLIKTGKGKLTRYRHGDGNCSSPK